MAKSKNHTTHNKSYSLSETILFKDIDRWHFNLSKSSPGHNSVVKVEKAEMNFLIISVSDTFNLLKEMEPFMELSK
ncbi:hypothetical protein E2542_SST17262 [Spatholobus suberectus]|nr:hypothetical protein E2542_SST17262 [Spatholobus suberectus]